MVSVSSYQILQFHDPRGQLRITPHQQPHTPRRPARVSGPLYGGTADDYGAGMQDDDEIMNSAQRGHPEDEAFYRDAIGIFSRFIVLANAGGAVRVLSFIGAGGERLRGLGWLTAIPAMLFVVGVVVAGFGLRATLKEAAWRRKAGIAETHAPEKEKAYRKSAG